MSSPTSYPSSSHSLRYISHHLTTSIITSNDFFISPLYHDIVLSFYHHVKPHLIITVLAIPQIPFNIESYCALALARPSIKYIISKTFLLQSGMVAMYGLPIICPPYDTHAKPHLIPLVLPLSQVYFLSLFFLS